MRLLWIVALTAMLVSADRGAFAQQAGSAPRLALIVGNSNYPDADSPLKEPLKDARALADELRRDGIGFEVEVAENLSKEAMRKAFDRFYGKIKSESVALVFFSGYAIQSARQSYIIPVDGQIWTEADVRRDGISLDTILKEMNTRGARVKIAVLDASRRNPFERRFRPVSAGLAPVDAPTGSLIMYSSAPSTVVNDTGGEHRLFVNEIVNQLRAPGLTAEETLNRARMAVTRGSNGQQVPWLSSSLISDFSFALQPGAKVAATSTTTTEAPAVPRPVVIPRMDPVVQDARPSGALASNPPGTTTRPPVSRIPPPMTTTAEDTAAIQDLNRKLRANPNDATAFYRRGQLYAKNDDFSRAIMDFDASIRLNPKDAEALNNRCWVRAIIGDLHAALQDCDTSLQIRPNYADSLDSRGFVKLKMGQPQNAIADYDAALQLSARKASSLYGRGIAKLRIGNTSGNNDIATAKSIDPSVADDFNKYGVR
jgi:tetratricopeptide (TPR) repeat protein